MESIRLSVCLHLKKPVALRGLAVALRMGKSLRVTNMATPAFHDIARIEYEGPKSKNPLAFKHYHATEKLDGKTLRDHLRFAVRYWHTFRNPLGDPFGPGTALRPWDDGSNSVPNAQRRVRVAFELIEKLGAPFYCFH